MFYCLGIEGGSRRSSTTVRIPPDIRRGHYSPSVPVVVGLKHNKALLILQSD